MRMRRRRWWWMVGWLAVSGAVWVEPLGGQSAPLTVPGEVIAREYAALNRHDVDGIFAVYSDSIRYGALKDSAVIGRSSKEALRQSLVPFLAKNPGGRVAILHQLVVGPIVVAHQRMTGTGDGKPVEILDVSEVRDGKVVAELETENLAPVPGVESRAAEAVAKRADDAFTRRDLPTAVSQFADPVIHHPWGDTVVQHISRAQAREQFEKALAENPGMHYTIIERMVAGPFVVEHGRLTGMADGKPRDALQIYEVRDGRIVAEWESPWSR